MLKVAKSRDIQLIIYSVNPRLTSPLAVKLEGTILPANYHCFGHSVAFYWVNPKTNQAQPWMPKGNRCSPWNTWIFQPGGWLLSWLPWCIGNCQAPPLPKRASVQSGSKSRMRRLLIRSCRGVVVSIFCEDVDFNKIHREMLENHRKTIGKWCFFMGFHRMVILW